MAGHDRDHAAGRARAGARRPDRPGLDLGRRRRCTRRCARSRARARAPHRRDDRDRRLERRPDAAAPLLFNIGALSLASLSAAGTFAAGTPFSATARPSCTATGAAAGATYFAVNTGLLALAVAVEGHEPWWRSWHERFAWLTSHYVFYGFIGGDDRVPYDKVGISGLIVFALPLWLQRNTQEAYLKHAQRSASKLRRAAATIQTQNQSLEVANKALKERSTAAMESLSATVDARDAYTAGHSRRVQQLALAIGRELGLSQAELDLLGHAALFHDIGKLAIPDAVLLKPSGLTGDEWGMMRSHAEEGARIIGRLGFLADAVPCDPAPSRALRRLRLPRRAQRRGDPARRADHPRRRRARLDAHDAGLPRGPARRGCARRAEGGHPARSSARSASPRSSGSCPSRTTTSRRDRRSPPSAEAASHNAEYPFRMRLRLIGAVLAAATRVPS